MTLVSKLPPYQLKKDDSFVLVINRGYILRAAFILILMKSNEYIVTILSLCSIMVTQLLTVAKKPCHSLNERCFLVQTECGTSSHL